jgi:uncharacterized protein (DUF1330 family)
MPRRSASQEWRLYRKPVVRRATSAAISIFPAPRRANKLRFSRAQEARMPAYFVVEQEVNNPAGMQPYFAAVGATLAQHGGRVLAAGGAAQLIEGGPAPKRIVIVEFPDLAAFKRWYNSPEYQKILPARLSSTSGRGIVVEGVG